MNSKYNPPINTKNTEDLLLMIGNPSDWEKDAVDQAQAELIKRGYSIEEQNRRNEFKNRYIKRLIKTKEKASLTILDAILYFIFSPPFLLLNLESLSDVFNSKNEGYKKIWKQKFILLFLGTMFWFVLIVLLFI